VVVSGLNGVTAISVGFEFACAVVSSGTVQCWGSNRAGLGHGTTTESSTPVTVGTPW
jgi:Regulator of chromosome condensation (RCC1) repeat